MPDYQRLLEKALAQKGRNAPFVSSVSNVTRHFPEKMADGEGGNAPFVSFVSKVSKRFSENFTDDDYQEAWEERAAIMEYDGGLSRHDAEVQANIICLETYRQLPRKTPS